MKYVKKLQVASDVDYAKIKTVRQKLRDAGRLLELAQMHAPGISANTLISSRNFNLLVDLVNSDKIEALYLPRNLGFIIKVCNIFHHCRFTGKTFFSF
jgi:hypothetical protein